MAKVTIDDKTAELEGSLTILQAAESLGIEIPHYCWHPGLPIAGNCRMCLVEIEKVPKLQIACNTRITDGMVVNTRNDRVKSAQGSVLEFLLVNHPIDCPICDQAGECKLQDYYMDYDKQPSRFAVEEKNRKQKVVPLGPRVMLDQERCILCLRCTRFLDEVTQTSELGVFNRGDRAAIDLAHGMELDNPYSENVVDICPVGALTSRDFRFQSRVWYLDSTPSVCNGCARGCNIDVYHRKGQVFRFRPRHNPDVNDYWICDEGRGSFHALQGEQRLVTPMAREGDSLAAVEWDEANQALLAKLAAVAEEHGGPSIAAIVSARASNEEAYLAKKLLEAVGGSKIVGHAASSPDAQDDELLRRADQNPNRAGLESLGIETTAAAVTDLLAEARAGKVKAIVCFGADLVGDLGADLAGAAIEELDAFALYAINQCETALYADWLLPIGAFFETDGTVTNFEGHVQAMEQAFPPPGKARQGWIALASALREKGETLTAETASDLTLAISAST